MRSFTLCLDGFSVFVLGVEGLVVAWGGSFVDIDCDSFDVSPEAGRVAVWGPSFDGIDRD